ncbi:hypothetical protein MKX01_041183 [Papaver californicum]|nr:hypothetical protein MKX01_041183 [Papaver californicum]
MYSQSILMAWASSKFTVLNQKPARQMCLPPMEMKMFLEVLYFNKQTSLNTFIKFFSYNICFWDLELHERMEAIGDFIQLRPPMFYVYKRLHKMYQIFQQSTWWWKTYQCLVAYNFENVKPYFCMQEQAIGQLVIATIHLESPCPAPPRDGHVHHRPTHTDVKLVNAHTEA